MEATQRPTPTPDAKLIIVGEEEMSRAITGGATEAQGLKAEGLQIRFRDDRMAVAADRLELGPVQVQQLMISGRLVAEDGKLYFEAETISPRGLVASLLPSLANQMLAQLTGQWYIEEVQARDGRLLLRIR